MGRPAAEDRLARVLAVLGLLEVKRVAHLDELAKRLKVAPELLRRDLELTMHAEAPGHLGELVDLTVDDDGTIFLHDIPDHLRRAPTLTRPEAVAVVIACRASLAIIADQPALERAVVKLEEELHVALVVDVERPPALDAFEAARDGKRRLRITYWSAGRDEVNERDVDPLRIEYLDGDWQARCFDHRSGERRNFRVDRVQDWAETGDTFDTSADPGDIEFTTSADMTAVQISFPATGAWVAEYLPVDVLERHDDGSIVVSLDCIGEWWLGRLLLRTGGHVLEPQGWRDVGRSAAQRVLLRYESD